jgi:hypothetical protein
VPGVPGGHAVGHVGVLTGLRRGLEHLQHSRRVPGLSEALGQHAVHEVRRLVRPDACARKNGGLASSCQLPASSLKCGQQARV